MVPEEEASEVDGLDLVEHGVLAGDLAYVVADHVQKTPAIKRSYT